MTLRLPGRHWRTVAGIAAYVVAAGAGLTWLLLSEVDRSPVAVLAVTAVVGLVVVLVRVLGRTTSTVRRMVGDTAVILDANPAHRVDPVGSGDLRPLVHAFNRLAERHESALREAERRAESARRDMESERNRLAALMAQLTVAVIVCNGEGRILLYNEAARSLFGEAPIGLGRSVFGVVDRGLFGHAADRLTAGRESAYTATTLHDGRLVRVQVTMVPEPEADGAEAAPGFVLVLDDLTREVRAGDERERMVRTMTESTRASLGSIRAAAESVLDFPDLTADERRRFLEIVRDEADGLGRRLGDLASGPAARTEDRVVTDIAGDDLVALVAGELTRAGVDCEVAGTPAELWVRADGHAVARAMVALVGRLHEHDGVGSVSLDLTAAGRHAQLDVRWEGQAPAPSTVDAWLAEPLGGAGTPTPRDVADRHGGEIWAADLGAGTAYLRMLLPPADGTDRRVPPQPRPEVASRPEYFDFDLFRTVHRPADLAGQRLEDLSFTVFDTETTGLDPAGGDRVISIGAVRVVNGRVLRQETFERLVQPQRSVPAASTAIHGITAAMLQGQPPITEVLPTFLRFAEDTVLVGHNVSFDLQFLKMSEAAAGVDLDRPALDTLLLHAALHPENGDHSLDAIAARLGISVVGRHTALGDALVTAEVFVALTTMLRNQGVETLGAALDLARQTYEARVDRRLYSG